jgi:molybdopterin-guanine dinucleotide biosynthesis protein B
MRGQTAHDDVGMKVIGIAGWSGAGKTTLLTRVIPRLCRARLRVSTIKHAHHRFDVDQPGKDSHTHRMAGATEVLVSSANRFALMHELRGEPELPLARCWQSCRRSISCWSRASSARRIRSSRSIARRSASRCSRRTIRTSCDRRDGPVAARVPVVRLDDIEAVADILVASAVPIDAVLARVSA